MTDLTPHKIDIFFGINDEVIPPTENSGQNISYNNAKHNDLINELQTTIDDLTSRIEAVEFSTASASTNQSLSFTEYLQAEANKYSQFDLGTPSQDGTITKIVVEDLPDVQDIGFYNAEDRIFVKPNPVREGNTVTFEVDDNYSTIIYTNVNLTGSLSTTTDFSGVATINIYFQ